MAENRSSSDAAPQMTVVVASFSPLPDLARCLEHLLPQAGSAEVIVVRNAQDQQSLPNGLADHPRVRFIPAPAESDVFQLRSRGVEAASGAWVILTEDHAAPSPQWLAELGGALRAGHPIVGGPIDCAAGCSLFDLALYRAEYGMYQPPLPRGPAAMLSGINIAYSKESLMKCREAWRESFRENEVNDALAASDGGLFMADQAVVISHLKMTVKESVKHLFGGGVHYARYRSTQLPPARRLIRGVIWPLVALVMLVRLLRHAAGRNQLRAGDGLAVAPLLLLLFAWSAGEGLGYLRGPVRPDER